MDSSAAKTQDGLLTYKGRPSLYYPAVRTDAQDEASEHESFPSKLASGLGTAKFLCGACLALLGGMAVYVQAWSAWTYGGIWSGLFAIFTGLCIILAARRQKPQNKSLLVALLILSVLGFFNTGLLATFTAMGLVAEVYMEDVAGVLVYRGVSNASPFVVQLLLLATATADSLLSLACCVISGREVCCCGRPTPAVINSRRDRLMTWLGSQQEPGTPQKIVNLPQVRLVPSVRQPHKLRSKTPSTLRVFSTPNGDINESLPSSSGGASANLSRPLVQADALGRSSRRRSEENVRNSCRTFETGHSSHASSRRSKIVQSEPRETQPKVVPLDEKYFELDRKLAEDFIDRTWNY